MTQDETWLLSEKYNGETTEGFFKDCERLSGGEPLAYVIGHIPFLGTTIFLDSHPLIPRTETEHWVHEVIEEIKQHSAGQNISVLDLCAGSGCIGVAVLSETPNAHVDFVEIDENHHTTILKNIRNNNIDEHRMHVVGGNLFEQLSDKHYDVILSNPPYIDPILDRTEESVRTHEPSLGLYGGQGGLDVITKILEETPAHLNPDGVLYIEHEPEQVEAIRHLGESLGFCVVPRKDQYGISRFTQLTRNSH